MNSSNLSNISILPSEANCRIWKEEYHQENYVSTLAAVILNIVTCPMTVCLNLLVVVAVIRKHRLQTMYNILLSALAATDLVVGAVVQPSFIVQEMSLIKGSSLTVYCATYNKVVFLFLAPCLASLSLLALLSIERYLAMKYSLRYQQIITTFRVATAVISCWVVALLPPVFIYSASLAAQGLSIAVSIVFVSLVVIFYCHISVYSVTRRHTRQIKSQRVSQDAAKKFLEDKKAAVGFAVSSFVPSLVYRFMPPLPLHNYLGNLFISFKPILLSCVVINSLCNPVIYCWRSSVLRKAMLELLGKKNTG